MQVVPEVEVSSRERAPHSARHMTWGWPSPGLHVPRSLLSCLELDRAAAGCPLVHRQRHVAQGLEVSSSLNTADIKAHTGCVNAVTFSNLGEEYLATGGDDARVLVWRVAHVIEGKCKPITMATIHQSNVFSIAFSCDNTIVYSAGNDSDVIKHDFASGRSLSVFPHNDVVYCVAAHPSSPQIILTASEDGTVHIIDTRLPRITHDMILAEDLHAFQSVAFNPLEPRLVAVGNTRYGAALFDSRQRKRLLRYKSTEWALEKQDVMSVCFNRAGTRLFTMQKHLPPTVFDIWNREPCYSFTSSDGGYRNSVTMKSGCFAGPRDEYIVSGSDDFRIYMWKIPDGRPVQVGPLLPNVEPRPHLVLPGHRSIVNQVRYSPRHSLMCSSGVEKVIKLWSHLPLPAGGGVQHSGDPPSRAAYSRMDYIRITLDGDMDHDPADPTQEDPSVLAFFDALIERADPHSSSSSSSPFHMSDDDDSSPAYLIDHSHSDSDLDPVAYHPHVQWVELPDTWSDASSTTTSSSPANTSSLEPPWSEEEQWSEDSSASESGAEERADEDEWEGTADQRTQKKADSLSRNENESAAGSLPGPSSENESLSSLPDKKRASAPPAKSKRRSAQPRTYCREDFLMISPARFYSSSQGSSSRQPVSTVEDREGSGVALAGAASSRVVAEDRNCTGNVRPEHGFQEKDESDDTGTRRDEGRTVELESDRNGEPRAPGEGCTDEGGEGTSANTSTRHKQTSSTISNGSTLKLDPSVP